MKVSRLSEYFQEVVLYLGKLALFTVLPGNWLKCFYVDIYYRQRLFLLGTCTRNRYGYLSNHKRGSIAQKLSFHKRSPIVFIWLEYCWKDIKAQVYLSIIFDKGIFDKCKHLYQNVHFHSSHYQRTTGKLLCDVRKILRWRTWMVLRMPV